ncbi:alcohol dehydrogenase catalytic domain-containing protein [Amycolatopsis sp. NPDC049868]|uniref:alcohol dehydrogenase catalytic domain-containing protein n=1 Tax=Amycolatopsis sp. NPDC049868 TaxID=3363934 RepID=UPI0037B4A590
MMTALTLVAHNEVALAKHRIPEPGPRDAVVRTTASMMCSSDVHTLGGAMAVPVGRILGHESVGVVHRVGDAVSLVQEGQRVASSAITPCGRCEFCQKGSQQCHGSVGGYKYTAQMEGTLAEYFLVPDADLNLAVIPEDLSDEEALYATDSLSTGLAAAEQASIPLGGTVAIFAQGAVGLAATMGARLLGAGMIVTTATRPYNCKLSRHYGSDLVLNPHREDAVERIREILGEHGADSAIEALGTHETFEQCVRATKAHGTVVNAGYHGWQSTAALPIPMVSFGYGMGGKQIRSVLCPGGSERLSRLFTLMLNKRIDPTMMTTHRFGFDDAAKAFGMLASKSDGIIKPLLTF